MLSIQTAVFALKSYVGLNHVCTGNICNITPTKQNSSTTAGVNFGRRSLIIKIGAASAHGAPPD